MFGSGAKFNEWFDAFLAAHHTYMMSSDRNKLVSQVADWLDERYADLGPGN